VGDPFFLLPRVPIERRRRLISSSSSEPYSTTGDWPSHTVRGFSGASSVSAARFQLRIKVGKSRGGMTASSTSSPSQWTQAQNTYVRWQEEECSHSTAESIFPR
jgi:hypothetical protein